MCSETLKAETNTGLSPLKGSYLVGEKRGCWALLSAVSSRMMEGLALLLLAQEKQGCGAVCTILLLCHYISSDRSVNRIV